MLSNAHWAATDHPVWQHQGQCWATWLYSGCELNAIRVSSLMFLERSWATRRLSQALLRFLDAKNITDHLGAAPASAWLWGAPGHTAAWGSAGTPGSPDFEASHQVDNSLGHWHLDWAGNPCSCSALRLGQRSTISTGAGLSTHSNLCQLGSSPKQLYWAVASYPPPSGHPRSMSLFRCPAHMLHPLLRALNSHQSALNSTGIHNHKVLRALRWHHYRGSCGPGLKASLSLSWLLTIAVSSTGELRLWHRKSLPFKVSPQIFLAVTSLVFLLLHSCIFTTCLKELPKEIIPRDN